MRWVLCVQLGLAFEIHIDRGVIQPARVVVDATDCDPLGDCPPHKGNGMKDEAQAEEESHAALAESKVGASSRGETSEAAGERLAEVHEHVALELELGAAQKSTSVQLPFGRVVGRELETVNEFMGIPFAAKPVRFGEPEAWVADFAGGAVAATTPTRCPHVPYSEDMSEDCLHLNVYAPKEPAEPRPVMLWFHGGALKTGSASQVNGTRLAAEADVLVVTANYRLGVLGFAPTYSNGQHSAPPVANNGFKDQRQAMRWVREHIAAFGGDPQRIALFGEGAGASSVLVHLVTPGSEGLFSRAITQSSDVESYVTLDEALSSTQEVADAVGCVDPADVQCLRAASVEALLPAYKQLEGMVVGDDFLPQSPLKMAAKASADVPILMNSNADEGNKFSYFGAEWLGEMTKAQAQGVFEGVSPVHSRTLMEMYGKGEKGFVKGDYRPALGKMIGDIRFHCSDRRFAAALQGKGRESQLWRSSFTRGNPCSPADVRGAYHGVERPFVFNSLEDLCTPSHEDAVLAATMSRIWGEFAREGRPPVAMHWAADTIALLGPGLSAHSQVLVQGDVHAAQCEFLDQALPNGNLLEDFVTAILVTSSLHQRLHHFLKEKVINFIINSLDLITSFAANSTHMTIHRNRVHTVVYLVLLGLVALGIQTYLRNPEPKAQLALHRTLFRRELKKTTAPAKPALDPGQRGVAARIADRVAAAAQSDAGS